MPVPFVHDVPAQRVVFAPGAIDRIAEEAERLGLRRTLVVATPGSGARLGARVHELLGGRSVGLHARAVIHVPRAVADAGIKATQDAAADGLVAIGGGSALGLAKAVAAATGLPYIALPTTYSGSEATVYYAVTEGERKVAGRDVRVQARTVIYDPDLSLALPAPVSAASGMNALAHAVGAPWQAERTPITDAYAAEALRRLSVFLPRVVADGSDRAARGECLIGAWFAGTVVNSGTWLQHRLAHVLGGLGLPHAETHAIILPHVTRLCLEAAPQARDWLAPALGSADPADALARLIAGFPIPQRLRDVGFDRGRIDFAAEEIERLAISVPRLFTADDMRRLLAAAY